MLLNSCNYCGIATASCNNTEPHVQAAANKLCDNWIEVDGGILTISTLANVRLC